MKFLHTSDWHVGRTIRNRSRADEHRAVFAEIIDIATHEQVDAVLVTGDVFHERRPPIGAEELVAQTLAELAQAQIPSVVIPGNHDDAARLRTLKPLGDLLQVHIVSDLSEDPEALIVPFESRDGKEKALIGCLPYLHPHQVLTAAEGAGVSEDVRFSMYQTKVQDYFRALAETMQWIDTSAVALLMAHLHIDQCEFGGGEWRSSVFPVDVGTLPGQLHYVALGHMHKPQPIAGAKSQARYAGSILQMDFGEREQRKSVSLIEAQPNKPAAVSQVELSKGKWLLRRIGTAEAILEQASDFADSWVEVILQPDGLTTELADRVRALPEVISLRFEEGQAAALSDGDAVLHSPGDRPAAELFSEYYKTKRKTDPEPELVALFNRLYQEVNAGNDGG